jgi:hypothetical protein
MGLLPTLFTVENFVYETHLFIYIFHLFKIEIILLQSF